MLNQETAKAARTDSGYILRAPRRMRVADAVAQYMRVEGPAAAYQTLSQLVYKLLTAEQEYETTKLLT
ncbi:TPA: hypothetical protein ACUK8G_003819 [Escherichia coli]